MLIMYKGEKVSPIKKTESKNDFLGNFIKRESGIRVAQSTRKCGIKSPLYLFHAARRRRTKWIRGIPNFPQNCSFFSRNCGKFLLVMWCFFFKERVRLLGWNKFSFYNFLKSTFLPSPFYIIFQILLPWYLKVIWKGAIPRRRRIVTKLELGWNLILARVPGRLHHHPA